MKSVKEINSIICKLNNQAVELDNTNKNLINQAVELSESWKGTSRFKDRKNDVEFIKWEQLHTEADNAHKAAEEIRKIITVWRFNLSHAKKAELLPIWVEVMKEYEGKKIGEVREKEIREKLKSFGVSGYFSKYAYSSPKISLSFLDKSGCCSCCDYVELTGFHKLEFFDENGKFKMPELETFKFYGESTPYIENPKSYIKNLEKLAEKARKAAASYDKAISEYNNAAVPGFSRIDDYSKSAHEITHFRIRG